MVIGSDSNKKSTRPPDVARGSGIPVRWFSSLLSEDATFDPYCLVSNRLIFRTSPSSIRAYVYPYREDTSGALESLRDRTLRSIHLVDFLIRPDNLESGGLVGGC